MSTDNLRRYFYILAAVAILAVIGGAIGQHNANKQAAISSTSQVIPAKTISFQGEAGKSVFAVLKENHQVESQSTSAGAFVTAIDGTANTDTNFWLYYVNGQAGTVASDQYQTKTTDKVEWRYEALQ